MEKSDDDEVTQASICAAWFASNHVARLKAVLTLAQEDGMPVAIVRAALWIVQKTHPAKLAAKWLEVVKNYDPAVITAEEAIAVTFIVNKAAKLGVQDARFYVLKEYCIWAALKLGAMGGWEADANGRPGFVIGVEGFGSMYFHVGEKAEMKDVLGQYAKRRAVVYPLPDYRPTLKIFRQLAGAG